MKVVLIDPRRTMTADIADLHLAIRPDGDVALFAGLLGWLAEHGALDRDFVERTHVRVRRGTGGSRRTVLSRRGKARPDSPRRNSTAFYELFVGNGEDRHRLQPGRQPVGIGHRQGQRHHQLPPGDRPHRQAGRGAVLGDRPAERDGRPRGRRARQHAGRAYGDREPRASRPRSALLEVRRRWPSRPGLKAVDMFRAVADGRIKALWIMATNPVDSMPDADARRGGDRGLPVRRGFRHERETDTIRHAHVRLPAAGWGEKDGTVTNSERRVSRQRPFLPLPGEARPDWWIITEVARRMGFAEAFAYASPAEIFAEHAALSGFENDGERDFDIGAYASIRGRRSMTRWRRSSGRRRNGAASSRTATRASSPTADSTRRTARRASLPFSRRSGRQPTKNSRSSSTPAACAITGIP